MYPLRPFKHYKQSNKLVNGIYLKTQHRKMTTTSTTVIVKAPTSTSATSTISLNSQLRRRYAHFIFERCTCIQIHSWTHFIGYSFCHYLWSHLMHLSTHISTPSFLHFHFHFHPSIHTISCSHRETQQCQSQWNTCMFAN